MTSGMCTNIFILSGSLCHELIGDGLQQLWLVLLGADEVSVAGRSRLQRQRWGDFRWSNSKPRQELNSQFIQKVASPQRVTNFESSRTWRFSSTQLPFCLASIFLASFSLTRCRKLSLLFECFTCSMRTLILLARILPLWKTQNLFSKTEIRTTHHWPFRIISIRSPRNPEQPHSLTRLKVSYCCSTYDGNKQSWEVHRPERVNPSQVYCGAWNLHFTGIAGLFNTFTQWWQQLYFGDRWDIRQWCNSGRKMQTVLTCKTLPRKTSAVSMLTHNSNSSVSNNTSKKIKTLSFSENSLINTIDPEDSWTSRAALAQNSEQCRFTISLLSPQNNPRSNRSLTGVAWGGNTFPHVNDHSRHKRPWWQSEDGVTSIQLNDVCEHEHTKKKKTILFINTNSI